MSSLPAAMPRVDFFDTSVRIDSPLRSLTAVFDHPIRDVLLSEDSIVVRIEPPASTTLNENIFGLSVEGERLWTIGHISHAYEDSPYTGLSRHADGSVWASNWDGASCRLSARSGAILEVLIGK